MRASFLPEIYLSIYLNDIHQIFTDSPSPFSFCRAVDLVVISREVLALQFAAFAALTELDFGTSEQAKSASAQNPCSLAFAVTKEMLVTTILVLLAIGGVAARCQYAPDENGHVVVPYGVTSLGYQAFDECSSLVSITLPESLTSIGFYAFQYCSSLTSVSLPDSLTELGGGAFHGATALASVSFGAGLTTTSGGETFMDCVSLTSVSFPEGFTHIVGNAFKRCVSLVSVSLPDSLTSIGNEAFSGATSLSMVYVPFGCAVSATAFSLGPNQPGVLPWMYGRGPPPPSPSPSPPSPSPSPPPPSPSPPPPSPSPSPPSCLRIDRVARGSGLLVCRY